MNNVVFGPTENPRYSNPRNSSTVDVIDQNSFIQWLYRVIQGIETIWKIALFQNALFKTVLFMEPLYVFHISVGVTWICNFLFFGISRQIPILFLSESYWIKLSLLIYIWNTTILACYSLQGDHFKIGHPCFREHSLSQLNFFEVFYLPPSYSTIFFWFLDNCESIILKK